MHDIYTPFDGASQWRKRVPVHIYTPFDAAGQSCVTLIGLYICSIHLTF